MFKNHSEMPSENRENVRGGNGRMQMLDIINRDEFKGKCRLFSQVTLDPGSSIGEHIHDQEEEIYYILSGNGVVNDNGQLRDIGPGDAITTSGGESHSIMNSGDKPLVFIAAIFPFN